ncbi:MAG: DNA polymerase III subunit epsilon, partial [Pseudomonadota bacterium]
KRLNVDNSGRELHGALLDSEILADVYLLMTGGQTDLDLASDAASAQRGASNALDTQGLTAVPRATPVERDAHSEYLALIEKESGAPARWLSLVQRS